MRQRITDPAELAAHRFTYVPADMRTRCQKHLSKLGAAVAWTWPDARGRFACVGFLGASQKPAIFYTYRTEESRNAAVRTLFAQAADMTARKVKARQEKAGARARTIGLEVGDVLRSSWGYEQTNIDYYEVTALVGSQMVEVRKIGCQSEDSAAYMQGQSVPAPGAYIGAAKRYRVSEYGARDSIRIASYAIASKLQHSTVQGIRVFPASNWTAYA
jgi:hypothetical protein